MNVSADAALVLRQLGGDAAAKAADLEGTAAGEAVKRTPLLPLARSFEASRDTAEHRHHGDQFAESALQIAIVLAPVSIVARASLHLSLTGASVSLTHPRSASACPSSRSARASHAESTTHRSGRAPTGAHRLSLTLAEPSPAAAASDSAADTPSVGLAHSLRSGGGLSRVTGWASSRTEDHGVLR